MKPTTQKIFSLLAFAVVSIQGFAQTYGGTTKIEEQVKAGSKSIMNMANYVTGSVLFIGMIWAIYSMVTNSQASRNMAIGFIAGFIFWGIVNLVVTI